MAMSCTITENAHGSVKKVRFSFVTAADGTASGTTTLPYNGEILAFCATSGSQAPTNLYDVTISDADSTDVLAGLGANITSGAAWRKLRPDDDLLWVVNSKLTLAVTNGGDTKDAVLDVYIR